MIFAIAAQLDLEMVQFDIKTSFLYLVLKDVALIAVFISNSFVVLIMTNGKL